MILDKNWKDATRKRGWRYQYKNEWKIRTSEQQVMITRRGKIKILNRSYFNAWKVGLTGSCTWICICYAVWIYTAEAAKAVVGVAVGDKFIHLCSKSNIIWESRCCGVIHVMFPPHPHRKQKSAPMVNINNFLFLQNML